MYKYIYIYQRKEQGGERRERSRWPCVCKSGISLEISLDQCTTTCVVVLIVVVEEHRLVHSAASSHLLKAKVQQDARSRHIYKYPWRFCRTRSFREPTTVQPTTTQLKKDIMKDLMYILYINYWHAFLLIVLSITIQKRNRVLRDLI